MNSKFGFDLCRQQILDRIDQQVSMLAYFFEASEDAHGDTPIERLFHFALYGALKFCEQEYFQGLIPAKRDAAALESAKASSYARNHIILQRQVQLEEWRVDFLITVYADWSREPEGGTPGWKQLIVECDGHDFHERTKEQAARDRARDRRFQLNGIEVFRFTGSELWRDPLACAEQVIAWANKRV